MTRRVRRRTRQRVVRAVVEDLRIARPHVGELTLDLPARGTGAGALPRVG